MTKARDLADRSAADLTAVSAGTGISVANGDGPIPTVTNTVATGFDAKGDLIVGTGADTFAKLTVASTAGYLLSVDSGETTGLKWSAPGGGGKVLQVVNATHSTSVNNATSTFADTGLTATITPSSSSSTILVIVSQAGLRKTADNVDNGIIVNLLRASTELVADFAGLASYTATALNNYVGSASISYLDSPNTTSATTYKTQFKNFVNANGVTVQVGPSTSSMTLLEIGA
jgi:hypothetical protein